MKNIFKLFTFSFMFAATPLFSSDSEYDLCSEISQVPMFSSPLTEKNEHEFRLEGENVYLYSHRGDQTFRSALKNVANEYYEGIQNGRVSKSCIHRN